MQPAEGTFRAAGQARRVGRPAASSPAPEPFVIDPGPVAAVPASIELDPGGLTLRPAGVAPVRAAYRDLAIVAFQRGTLLLRLGFDDASETWLLDQLGDRLGPLARGLRDGRLRQRLADGFVQLDEAPIELVEFASTDGRAGVGQLAVHGWGAVLAPLDERLPWIRWRRADLEATLAGAGSVGLAGAGNDVELRGLGEAAVRQAARLGSLRQAAFDDAARLTETLLPDAPFGIRRHAAQVLIDGRPADRATLDGAWESVEAAVLVDEAFAESYRALVATAGGERSRRWLAVAPTQPGGDEARSWFMVPLPGNLVALELVSEGAHATYCFRVVPRATFHDRSPQEMDAEIAATVRLVSDALVDARFLREPMALPADQLATPRGLRYRLALRALPSVAEARRRFVARLIHRDIASWQAALDDLVRWHGATTDEAAEWPGRGAQEAEVRTASGGPGGEATGMAAAGSVHGDTQERPSHAEED